MDCYIVTKLKCLEAVVDQDQVARLYEVFVPAASFFCGRFV